MREPIFEIRNAKVWRGDTLALRDVSLTLHHGESVVILGPNGAGKSSFLKLLTGEVRPEVHSDPFCRLFGKELWSLEELRHRIGVVMPEEVARFDPDELAIDAVLSSLRGAYGRTREMRFSRLDRSKAEEAMQRMGVTGLAHREFGTLSSGEQRRILIARALAIRDVSNRCQSLQTPQRHLMHPSFHPRLAGPPDVQRFCQGRAGQGTLPQLPLRPAQGVVHQLWGNRLDLPAWPGWKHIEQQIVAEGGHRVNARLALKVLCVFLGAFAVWGSLFGIGSLLYGKPVYAIALFAVAIVSMIAIFRSWDSISGEDTAD